MRTPWLLLSIALHGVAITAALGFGVSAQRSSPRPPARVAVQSRQAAVPAQRQDEVTPKVTPEEPVRELPPPAWIDPAAFEVQQQEEVAVVDPRTLSPSEMLKRATLERIREPVREPPPLPQRVPTPVPAPAEQQPVAAPPAPVQQARSEARERSDNEPPRYPERERRLEREGIVVVRAMIDAQGMVQDVSLLTPSRYSGFNREALRAVRRWRFEPATCDGVPVESETDIEVVFRLRDS